MRRIFFRRKKRKRRKKQEGFIKRFGTLNIVLICVFAYMIIFNQQMITLYQQCGSAPESAWCALVAALIGECGICGWIKTNKEKHRTDSDQIEEPQETGPPSDPEGDPEEDEDDTEEMEDGE